jgi:hypothetical protein
MMRYRFVPAFYFLKFLEIPTIPCAHGIVHKTLKYIQSFKSVVAALEIEKWIACKIWHICVFMVHSYGLAQAFG